MPVSVALNTPLAEKLSNVVQPKLVEVGWSTGGLDDSALAEYIILMLVNGKTQDQIASELSNDLLNLGPDDSGATDFAKWLFEQVEVLSNPAPTNSAVTQHPELQTSLEQDVGRESKESGGSGSQDAEMSEAMEVVQEGAMLVIDINISVSLHSTYEILDQRDRNPCETEVVQQTGG